MLMINKSYLKPVMKVLYKPKAKPPFHQKKFLKNLIKYNVNICSSSSSSSNNNNNNDNNDNN